MKTLHTWQCPHHGVLRTIVHEPSPEGDGAVIAIRATQRRFSSGCAEPTPTSRGMRMCGEQVIHVAGASL